MTTDTANLQSRPTVRQAALLMNVSERSVYMAAAVQRLRPDLAAELDAGTMTVAAAYGEATGKRKETPRDRLLRAWNNATEDDRAWLLAKALHHAR